MNPSRIKLIPGQTVEFQHPGAIQWKMEPTAEGGTVAVDPATPSQCTYQAPAAHRLTKVRLQAVDANNVILCEAVIDLLPESFVIEPLDPEIEAGDAIQFRVQPEAWQSEVTWEVAPTGFPHHEKINHLSGAYQAPKRIWQPRQLLIHARAKVGQSEMVRSTTVRLSDRRFWSCALIIYLVLLCPALLFVTYRIFCQDHGYPDAAPNAALRALIPPMVTLRPSDSQTFFLRRHGEDADPPTSVRWTLDGQSIPSPVVIAPPTVPTSPPSDTRVHSLRAVSTNAPGQVFESATLLSSLASLSITPPHAILREKQAVQFQADLKPASSSSSEILKPNRFVWWVDAGGVGRIDSNGWYQAPENTGDHGWVTVQVRHRDHPELQAAALVELQSSCPWDPCLVAALAIIMGSLGAVVHAMTSLSTYQGNRSFQTSWANWYVILPLRGGILALIVYFLFAADMIKTSGVGGLAAIAGIAGLVGLFASEVTEKLGDIARAIFGSNNDRRGDRLEGNTPQKATTTTTSSSAGAGKTTVP